MLRPETEIVVSKGPFPGHILLGLFLRCLPVAALTASPLKLFTPEWPAARFQAKNLLATCKRIQTDILVHKKQ